MVDFESGRVLYVIFDPGSKGGQDLVGIPPYPFHYRSGGSQSGQARTQGAAFDLRSSNQQVSSAPKITDEDRQNLADVEFATKVYRHFNVPIWWTEGGKFNHVMRSKAVPGATVQNVSNEKLGRLDQLIIDLPAGRVAYAPVDPEANFAQQNEVVPIPPMAITAGQDAKTKVLDANLEKLRSAPRVNKNQLQRMSDLQFATSVYQYWGKQPWFQESYLSPTGPDRRDR